MTIYQEEGYENRKEYLMTLPDIFGVDYDTVIALANVLGSSEDFDGLISALEDMEEY